MKLKFTQNKKTTSWMVVLFALAAGLLHSCTKTEIVPYEAQPQARINSFKIVNTAEEMVGAIDHHDKVITLTIPAGQYLKTLEPELTLPDGCTLKEGADSLITDVVAYFAEGSTREINYPITANDGSIVTYTLLIKTYQPPLDMQEVTADPENPVSYDNTLWYRDQRILIYNVHPTYPYVIGNIDLDIEMAQASLIAEDGTEYKINQPQSGSSGLAYMVIDLDKVEGRQNPDYTYSDTPPEGLYYIKLRYYSRETTLKNPIRIYYNN